METLASAVEFSVWLIVGTTAAIVLTGMLNGTINLNGLLRVKSGPSESQLSPARVQALLVTLAAAFDYLSRVLADPNMTMLPDAPSLLLTALGASHGVYLASKAYAVFSSRFQQTR